jgi:hypothetical protein
MLLIGFSWPLAARVLLKEQQLKKTDIKLHGDSKNLADVASSEQRFFSF